MSNLQDALRNLSTPIASFDNQITFHMIPYRTMQLGIILRELAAQRGIDLSATEEMSGEDVLFACCEASTADVTFDLNGDATPDMHGLAAYWQNRTSNALHNYALFNQVISPRIRDAWWAAYEASRDTVGE